jgi:hypothetical protein
VSQITICKLDHRGNLKFEYHGEIVERGDGWVCLRAPFVAEQADLGFVVFRRGDVFTEWHYAYRWYNVFQINSGEDGSLKGWYCNITRPAIFVENGEETLVSAEDLALDVYVMPDGRIRVLDEDEFKALESARLRAGGGTRRAGMMHRSGGQTVRPRVRIFEHKFG